MAPPMLTALYPWIKSFHFIAMVAWMAGMFYLPRLYVYHCATQPGSSESERFKTMEYRLSRQIVDPAMTYALFKSVGVSS